jgi:hypothetical protein
MNIDYFTFLTGGCADEKAINGTVIGGMHFSFGGLRGTRKQCFRSIDRSHS